MILSDLIPYVILACCVLHNICLEGYNDKMDDLIEDGRKREIDNEQNQIQIPVYEIREEIVNNDNQGLIKHNYLAALIT